MHPKIIKMKPGLNSNREAGKSKLRQCTGKPGDTANREAGRKAQTGRPGEVLSRKSSETNHQF